MSYRIEKNYLFKKKILLNLKKNNRKRAKKIFKDRELIAYILTILKKRCFMILWKG